MAAGQTQNLQRSGRKPSVPTPSPGVFHPLKKKQKLKAEFQRFSADADVRRAWRLAPPTSVVTQGWGGGDADAQTVSVWMREPTGCLPCSLESVCLFRHVWLANENRCVRGKPAHRPRAPAHAYASRKGWEGGGHGGGGGGGGVVVVAISVVDVTRRRFVYKSCPRVYLKLQLALTAPNFHVSWFLALAACTLPAPVFFLKTKVGGGVLNNSGLL